MAALSGARGESLRTKGVRPTSGSTISRAVHLAVSPVARSDAYALSAYENPSLQHAQRWVLRKRAKEGDTDRLNRKTGRLRGVLCGGSEYSPNARSSSSLSPSISKICASSCR
eukprot:1454852-Pleurochrysis_carterae.AAC.1